MNAGQQTIKWLYSTQLQVDDQWAVRRPDGFTWWASQNAQTIEIIGEEEGHDGQTGYLIGVRTDMVDDLDLTDQAAEDICTEPMQTAALAGPVYDPETRRLRLCSLALVHDENAQWMRVLLSAAAATQLAEAMLLGPALAEQVHGRFAVSAHPDGGVRETPDEIALSARLLVEDGRQPCRWQAGDFEQVVQQHMMQRPSLGASSAGSGLTVEFPYADGTSLCQMIGDSPHPLYGSGLLILQRFPFSAGSTDNGARLAMALNQDDLSIQPAGYGFGSYTYRDNIICFNAFIPHALKGAVTLANLYYSCAVRARSVARRLVNRDWDA